MLEKETAILALKNHELDAYTEMNPEGIKQLQDSDDLIFIQFHLVVYILCI